MEAIKNKNRETLVSAAMGRIPCDLTIVNVKLVNVLTGEIYPAEVDVKDSVIVRTRTSEYPAQLPSAVIFDGGGKYLVPGCFDTHLHIESTYMTPHHFGRTVIKCGTTTVVHDPHEIGNVMGIQGVKGMLDNAVNAPVRIYALAPSCVPSVKGVESAGAEFTSEEMKELLKLDGILGLAEVMDYNGVMNNTPVMRGILDAALDRGAYIQGHLPALTGDPIAAYRVAGVQSCHESLTGKAVREKLRSGTHVNLRYIYFVNEGLRELLTGLEGMKFTDNVSVCTDDVPAREIIENGHVNRTIRKMLEAGIEPLAAYRFATYNGARSYGFTDLGAIAPGFAADMQLLEALDGRNPDCVFVGGKLVVSHGELTEQYEEVGFDCSNTVNIPQLREVSDLRIKAPSPDALTADVAVLRNKTGIFDELIYENLPVRDGYVDISDRAELCYVAIINRYGKGGITIALKKDFGLLEGAAASTVSHDSHNLTVVYKSPEDAYLAVRELEKAGGGFIAVKNGKVLKTFALPIAGLMGTGDAQATAREVAETDTAIGALCGGRSGMPVKLTLMCLPCIPSVVLTDYGIYDAEIGKFLPPFKPQTEEA